MRTRRIKIEPKLGEAVYHCISRTVNGEWLFDAVDKEAFRHQLWAVADYCGVEVVTWTILSNHFHVLTRIPQIEPVSDEELLRRYHVLYPKPSKYHVARLEVIKAHLRANTPEAQSWRQRQLAQMGDVSAFMKLLKQRFTVWYNCHHDRFGTIWAERFTSVLAEPKHEVVLAMAVYIDLNCVRAGICTDPKGYRFCGYAEALAGSKRAQQGILSLVGNSDWGQAQAAYRELLFTVAAKAREGAAQIPEQAAKQVVAAKGKLPLAELLRHRVIYFSRGAVLGGKIFVEEQLNKYRQLSGRRKRTEPHSLANLFGCEGLLSLRRCRSLG